MKHLILLSLSLLIACSESDPKTEDPTSTEEGTLMVNAPTFVGETVEECQVQINAVKEGETNWSEGIIIVAPDSISLPAGDYRLQIGSGNYGGVPGCVLPDGNIVVAPAVSASVVKGEENEVSPTMNQYASGRFDCLLEKWDEEDNPDVDAPFTTYDEGPWDLRVEDGDNLVNLDAWNWHGVFSLDFEKLEVQGNTLVLYDPDTIHLQASSLSANEIFFQIWFEGYAIMRMTCTPH